MNVDNIFDILTIVFIFMGAFLGLIGGIGILRLPDTYARLHAVGITDTLCTFLILLGLGFQATGYVVVAKLILVFLFLLFTSPTSSYALANSAYRWGLRHQQDVHEPTTNEDKK